MVMWTRSKRQGCYGNVVARTIYPPLPPTVWLVRAKAAGGTGMRRILRRTRLGNGSSRVFAPARGGRHRCQLVGCAPVFLLGVFRPAALRSVGHPDSSPSISESVLCCSTLVGSCTPAGSEDTELQGSVLACACRPSAGGSGTTAPGLLATQGLVHMVVDERSSSRYVGRTQASRKEGRTTFPGLLVRTKEHVVWRNSADLKYECCSRAASH